MLLFLPGVRRHLREMMLPFFVQELPLTRVFLQGKRADESGGDNVSLLLLQHHLCLPLLLPVLLVVLLYRLLQSLAAFLLCPTLSPLLLDNHLCLNSLQQFPLILFFSSLLRLSQHRNWPLQLHICLLLKVVRLSQHFLQDSILLFHCSILLYRNVLLLPRSIFLVVRVILFLVIFYQLVVLQQ